MSDARKQITQTVKQLEQLRDELRVKLHLAKVEAKDEWASLEQQWEKIRPKLEAARKEAGKTVESIGSALSLAVDELKKSYERLRKLL